MVSPTAIAGLTPTEPLPWSVCESTQQWCDELLRLWSAPRDAEALGRAARSWVEQRHSWAQAGELADASVRRVCGNLS